MEFLRAVVAIIVFTIVGVLGLAVILVCLSPFIAILYAVIVAALSVLGS